MPLIEVDGKALFAGHGIPVPAGVGARKPVFALIAGREARRVSPWAHAGALVQGGSGTLESKTQSLTRAWASVFSWVGALIDRCGRYDDEAGAVQHQRRQSQAISAIML